MMMGQQVVGGTGSNFKPAAPVEDKRQQYPAPYGNSYTKPLDETQINGVNSKRATPGPSNQNSTNNRAVSNNLSSSNNIFGGAQQQSNQHQNYTNGFVRGGSSAANGNKGAGVKDALTYSNVPAPKIATTNVRVRNL